MLHVISRILWGNPIRKLISVMTGLFILPAWVFNYEDWLTKNGYNELLTSQGSPVRMLVSDALVFLFSTEFKIFLSGAAIALIAEGLWRFRNTQIDLNRNPSPDSQIAASQDSSWALGITAISAKDAACAFAGVSSSEYKKSPKSKAIYNEIKTSAEIGFIPTMKRLEVATTRGNGGSLNRRLMVDKPWKGQTIDYNIIFPASELHKFFKDKPWDHSWIIQGSNSSVQSPLGIGQEKQR